MKDIEREVNGRLEGVALYYFPNGKLETIGHWRCGKPCGIWIQYDADTLYKQANNFNWATAIHGLEIEKPFSSKITNDKS